MEKTKKQFSVRQLAIIGLLSALVFVFSWIQVPVGDVGRVHLGNVFCALSGLLFGNVFAILYSLAGGLFSFLVMWLLKKTDLFSIVGVSMAGGVAHNLGQLALAALVVSNAKLFYYFPALLFAGMFTGILIGIVAWLVCKRLPRI